MLALSCLSGKKTHGPKLTLQLDRETLSLSTTLHSVYPRSYIISLNINLFKLQNLPSEESKEYHFIVVNK